MARPPASSPGSRSSPSCPFCNLPPERIVAQNEVAQAIRDAYPVNQGHTLVIPRRHVADWFDTDDRERKGILDLLDAVKRDLDQQFAPAGYNVGFNTGPAAGQTVMHLHLHLIPRFEGDVDDPTGGVRLVIPERGNYRTPGHIPRTPGKKSD